MAELLFVTPQEMTSSTILSGNTDTDKYLFCILNTQLTTIEPLLGSELYDKIISDIEAETLTGLYLELYTDFIKPITKNEALAQYIEIASYMVDNAGIYKRSGENVEVVDKDEVQYLSGKYKSLAQMYVTRFEKWICKNPLIEYKTIQDEVNALKNINLNVGWKL
ncbi:MAG: hypothetical protein RL308_3486 [Bacteroidota bacterium]|jgi:hypothetical protein